MLERDCLFILRRAACEDGGEVRSLCGNVNDVRGAANVRVQVKTRNDVQYGSAETTK